MKNYPYFPKDAPFNEEQRSWLGGFLSGLNSRLLDSKEDKKDNDPEENKVLLLYGTQTGNAESLAEEAAEKALQLGIHSSVMGMDEVTPEALQNSERTLIITSTYGEGEMPDNAQVLWDAMKVESAPRLDNTHFAVLGLGDTSYDLFCQAAVDWDNRLEALGAQRILSRVDCDLDYEEPFNDWISALLPALVDLGAGGNNFTKKDETNKTKQKWSKKVPFPAKLFTNKILTKNASTKETRHYEISLKDSEIDYNVGDALGVIPTNCPELVSSIIKALSFDPEVTIATKDGESKLLTEALLNDFEIKLPSKELVAFFAERSDDKNLNNLLLPDNKKEMSDYMWGRDLIDFIIDYQSVKLTSDKFVSLLKPIQPRLYSISSSHNKHPGEVHLTVASVRYESFGNERKGVCSTFLADRITEETLVKCYLVPNKNFGVPKDDSLPMIMVGPGTGIAPFRAFLEEREVTNSPGKNWLFFGERNRDSDFLYEDELLDWKESGLLNRLDLAFSRDQEEKVYVQDLMREQGAELFTWLEQGSYFFVCGDAQHMAKDVDKALFDVIKEHGKLSDDEASNYVSEMKKAKRYVRDVY